MAEIQNSPSKSKQFKEEIKKVAGSIKTGVRRSLTLSGMAKVTALPNGEISQTPQAKELSSVVRALEENAGDVQERKQLEQREKKARTNLKKVRQSQLERTLDERFERGEMFRILKRIRKKMATAATDEKKEIWRKRSHAALEISRNLARNLDILNNQYYNPKNLKMVPVELDSEDYQIPVRHYSLGEVATPQDAPPLVILGGAGSGHKVTKSTAEAFALQYPGRDVYVVSYPDSLAAVIPDNFPEKIKGQDGLNVYTRLLRKAIENLGLEQFDLIGISMGGGIGIGMGIIKDERDEGFV